MRGHSSNWSGCQSESCLAVSIPAFNVQVLMNAMEGCESLRVLELGYNVFGAEGMQHLSDALRYNLQACMQCLPDTSTLNQSNLSVLQSLSFCH